MSFVAIFDANVLTIKDNNNEIVAVYTFERFRKWIKSMNLDFDKTIDFWIETICTRWQANLMNAEGDYLIL